MCSAPSTVYLTCTAVFVLASILISLIQMQRTPPDKKPVTVEAVFAGFRYIRHNPVVLGAISLDLFAMLLGGVTALLPIYAKDVLVTGPWGLGLLRSAPAIGALAISIWLAHHQLQRRVGHVLFVAVAAFGAAAVAFAFSTSIVLSIAALAVYGAADAVSVVIRHSLVQTRTPNEMLGRVMAVNFMFTGTSGHAWRIPRRRGRGAVRRVHLGAGRRHRRDRRRAALDEAVSGASADRHDRGQPGLVGVVVATARSS